MREQIIIMGALTAAALFYFIVMRGAMNKFQWFPFWGNATRRIYWIARNDAPRNIPHVSMGFLYFDITEGLDTQARYFHGRGVLIRFWHYSFQLGFGRLLQASPWYREIDVEVEDIREGTDGNWE